MKFNQAKRSIFVAEMQSELGGSENARNAMRKLIRFASQHHRLTVQDNKDGLRRTERLIRNLLVRWFITARFKKREELPDDNNPTITITLSGEDQPRDVPFLWDSKERRKYNARTPNPKYWALASRFAGRAATRPDEG